MNIKIFTCCHKECPTINTNYIEPIHAGKALSKLELNMVGDNTGENISERNPYWCELTVLYWMWKNVEADYYGLFHYRRYLSFSGNIGIFTKIDDEEINKFGWDDSSIENVCKKYDILTSPIWPIHPVGMPENIMTSYDFYASEHFSKDLDIVLDIIEEKYPETFDSIKSALAENKMFFANMMIMKKEYFHAYMEWLFDILFEAERRIDISSYDSYQKRIWGFLAERLANCYLKYLIDNNKNIKIKHLEMAKGYFDSYSINIEKVKHNILLQREKAINFLIPNRIQVAFCIDNNYSKYCGVALKSLLENINFNQEITVHIINDGSINDENRLKFNSMLANYPNAEINFVDIDSSQFDNLPNNRKHISIATYFRLKMHKFLPLEVKKVIYMDSDIIVCDNIAYLWQFDLGGKLLAGTYDEGGIMQQRRLHLPVNHPYFNAGITILNLEKMRAINADNFFMKCYENNKDIITLQDQDILNIASIDDLAIFDLRWNANGRLYVFNDLERMYSKEMALKSVYNPGILHFTDAKKPWKYVVCGHPLKELYFEYLDRTPWKQGSLIRYAVNLINNMSMEMLGDQFSVTIFNYKVVLDKKYFRWIYRILYR